MTAAVLAVALAAQAQDPGLGRPCAVVIDSVWSEPSRASACIAWTRDFWEAVRPYSTGRIYVNFLGEEGQGRVRAAYGATKYERLQALKRTYDPTNFFRLNQNVAP